jgi:hypothetical protein
MHDIEQTIGSQVVNPGSRFLEGFAHGTFGKRFTIFKVPGRKGPQAFPGLNATQAQKNPVLPFRYASHHYLGILVVDQATGLAAVAGSVFIGGNFQNQSAAAGRTVFHVTHVNAFSLRKPLSTIIITSSLFCKDANDSPL